MDDTIKFSDVPHFLAPEKALEQFIVELKSPISALKDLSMELQESLEPAGKTVAQLSEIAAIIEAHILSIYRYVETQLNIREETQGWRPSIDDFQYAEVILGEFAREIRGPIAGIKGFSGLLREKVAITPAEQERIVADLCKQIENIVKVHQIVSDNWQSWLTRDISE